MILDDDGYYYGGGYGGPLILSYYRTDGFSIYSHEQSTPILGNLVK